LNNNHSLTYTKKTCLKPRSQKFGYAVTMDTLSHSDNLLPWIRHLKLL